MSSAFDSITTFVADSGVRYLCAAPHPDPRPTLIALSGTALEALTVSPYCRTGDALYAAGWNVISIDLPCHGADCRPGEPEQLEGWAKRIGAGEDIVAAHVRRVSAVIDHAITTGLADPARIALAGTSRGGFMALHAAASDPRIRAVAAFAPVTVPAALREFAGVRGSGAYDLIHFVGEIASRNTLIVIGNDDERVGTHHAVALAAAVAIEAQGMSAAAGRHTLSVVDVPGHISVPEWHDQAADWIGGVVG